MMDIVDGIIVTGIIILVMCIQVGWRLKQKLRITNTQIQNLLFLNAIYVTLIIGLIVSYSQEREACQYHCRVGGIKAQIQYTQTCEHQKNYRSQQRDRLSSNGIRCYHNSFNLYKKGYFKYKCVFLFLIDSGSQDTILYYHFIGLRSL